MPDPASFRQIKRGGFNTTPAYLSTLVNLHFSCPLRAWPALLALPCPQDRGRAHRNPESHVLPESGRGARLRWALGPWRPVTSVFIFLLASRLTVLNLPPLFCHKVQAPVGQYTTSTAQGFGVPSQWLGALSVMAPSVVVSEAFMYKPEPPLSQFQAPDLHKQHSIQTILHPLALRFRNKPFSLVTSRSLAIPALKHLSLLLSNSKRSTPLSTTIPYPRRPVPRV
ncbi:hypothetical protein GQ44DRAFT_195519 [Phaeosphaeriaceae sp. PMI808]|nr:hypothetical protein GQ44DRAFT_195519 [Phaeosphaeriaceae sp. PMI808]